MSLRQRRFLFIITYGRSGSTLLMNFLNKLPEFLIRGENAGILMHVWRASAATRHMKSKGSVRSLRATHPWFGAVRAKGSHFERDMQESFVDNILRPGNARVIGDKNIGYGPSAITDEEFQQHVDWLLEWPNARVLFNVRNVEDTARSGWWANMDRDDAKQRLQLITQRFETAAERHPKQTRIFSYDDFSNNPEYAATFADFLDVEEHTAVRCARSALAKDLTH